MTAHEVGICMLHHVYESITMEKHDELFLGVLKEEGNILGFLDAIFGFLYRCTDFYKIREQPSDTLGFPPGVAESCVLKVLNKWKRISEQPAADELEVPVPVRFEEVEVAGSCEENLKEAKCLDEVKRKEVQEDKSKVKQCKPESSISEGDSYNGAIRDAYRWSQSIVDLDVKVPVTSDILKARDVRVNITATSLNVAVKRGNEWEILLEGELCWKTNKEESIWSLDPGKHIQIHLEKSQERWWDSLLTSEPKIDLSNIDASKPMDELAQDEQMKIQELMWNQERKMQGLPTSDQLATEKILKEAWDKEGSPFKGMAYDPTIVNFSSSFPENLHNS